MDEPETTVKTKGPRRPAPERELSQKFSMQIYRADWVAVEALAVERDRTFTRVARDLIHEALEARRAEARHTEQLRKYLDDKPNSVG